MAGASVSLLALDDDLEELLAAPASSPFYRDGTLAADHALDDLVPATQTGGHEPAELLRCEFESKVRQAIRAVAATWPDHADEFRQLDAALGDGDLGITVSAGSRAVASLLDDLPARVAGSTLLREAGLAFASANPSTFAALVGGGLVAAATEFDDTHQATAREGIAIGRAAAAFVARKGGAERGDKTLLDVLVPVLDALDTDPDDLERAASLAWELVSSTAQLQSRRGRAAWHQDRSIGLRDPGSVAVAYLLDTLLRGRDSMNT
jgi:dihydroxyacetone kinase